MPDFVAADYLKQRGLNLVGANEDGTLKISDPSGATANWDPKAALNAELLKNGVDPKSVEGKINVVANTPDTALPDSPASIKDRFYMSLGNKAGSVDYLSKKFQGVQIDKNNGIVVNDKGLWKQVDPDLLKGDGWTISEGLKDLADLGGSAIVLGSQFVGSKIGGALGKSAGGALGAAGTGNPVMATVGAGAGEGAGQIVGGAAGAAAGEEIRTRLGRIVGTYKATDQEHMEDVAVEALAGAAGETLAIGARPTWNWFKGVMEKYGSKASDAVKSVMAGTLGNLTQAGSTATKIMMDDAAPITAKLTSAQAAGAKGAEQITQKLAEGQLADSTSLLKEATQALPKRYGEALDSFFQQAEAKNLKVDYKSMALQAQSTFEEQGLGKVITSKDGSSIIRKFTPEELQARYAAGLPVAQEAMTKEGQSAIQQVFRQLEGYKAFKPSSGQAAARTLTGINRGLNSVTDSLQASAEQAAYNRVLAQASSGWKNAMGDTFTKAGLKDSFEAATKLYRQYGDAVSWARTTLDSGKGLESFTNQLINSYVKPGTNKFARTNATVLAELLGQRGTDLTNSVVHAEVAKRFAPMAMRFTAAQGSGAAIAGYMVGGKLTGGLAVAAVAPQTSPRLVLNEAQLAQRTIRGLSPMARQIGDYGDLLISTMAKAPGAVQSAWLQDPRILGGALEGLVKAGQKEEQIKSQLIQKANGGR